MSNLYFYMDIYHTHSKLNKYIFSFLITFKLSQFPVEYKCTEKWPKYFLKLWIFRIARWYIPSSIFYIIKRFALIYIYIYIFVLTLAIAGQTGGRIFLPKIDFFYSNSNLFFKSFLNSTGNIKHPSFVGNPRIRFIKDRYTYY